jgi:phage/plasmid-like protein (TIGR03299 family)
MSNILESAKLNWSVRTEPVQTESGLVIKGYNAIVRNDNNKPLSIMSDTYYPYQNSDLLEMLERVASSTKGDLELHSGGHFRDGARLFIQLKSKDLIIGDDRVEGYLTGINSFDGSTSLAFGPSNITISCMNTFFAAFREMRTKVRHTKNMVDRVDEIVSVLEKASKEEQKIFAQIERMIEVPFSDVLRESVSKAILNIEPKIDIKDRGNISTRTYNNLKRLDLAMDREIGQKGSNLWGLFSGVTRFTTHDLTGDTKEKKMFGVHGRRELGIFNELGLLVD